MTKKQAALSELASYIIGIGGGKAIDAAKVVADGEKLIIVPTIVSTDAPTSHSAVIYTPTGEFEDYAYFKSNPDVVLVDTTVIAQAPTRFLVAGIGDSLSTYFEARAVRASHSAVNAGLPCGAREGHTPKAVGTLTSMALAELCYETILEDGLKAKIANDAKVVTPALENIIEANTLLSGLGFESGGLAAIHAIHNGLTVLEPTHDYLHGEKVAFATICQLVLENAPMHEIEEVIEFCISVGLPVTLVDLGVKSYTKEEMNKVAAQATIPEESIHNMPFPVNADMVAAAITTADELGKTYKA